MQWLLLLGAIVAAVAGQVLLKFGAGAATLAQQATDWRTLAGLGFYGLAALLYATALRRIPVSVALPCTALSYLVVAAIGYTSFNEPLGPQKLVALAVIAIGVALLATA
jgi:multidrug transporter EmrE-like cation transporter